MLSATPILKPSSPANFLLVEGSVYDITFNGEFKGDATLCLSYDGEKVKGEPNQLELIQRDGSGWKVITTSLDVVNDSICGETSSLTAIAVGEPDADGDGAPDSIDEFPNDPKKQGGKFKSIFKKIPIF
jgi:hypothetical protein